jgi:hypothetical protein
MELTGVEPVSALSINAPFIHRFSLSDPLGGIRFLFLTGGVLDGSLKYRAHLRKPDIASVGVRSSALNGVNPKTLEPLEVIKQQQQLLAYEQRKRCCSHLLFFEP